MVVLCEGKGRGERERGEGGRKVSSRGIACNAYETQTKQHELPKFSS